MAIREIIKVVTGKRAIDGAGVHLVRVLGHGTVEEFDPFLMLDSFDSYEPQDYILGFPLHPHRGIETITYLIEGEINHEDSLGNAGTIRSGESQWMTAGSGIMHQEMPQACEHMLGFQLWLNLPREEKMTPPQYYDISADQIPAVKTDFGVVRVISGEYAGKLGAQPRHIPATIYDISLKRGHTAEIPTKGEETVFIFLIDGDAVVNGAPISSKSAVLFGPGDVIRVGTPRNADSRLIFYSGRPLREPVAWGGPIVMNTEEELQQTFAELKNGTFIHENAMR